MSTTTKSIEDKFNVGPKEYAAWADVHEVTARKMFVAWFELQEVFIRRRGVPTKRYPKGRNLVMSRNYFNKLKGLG